MLNGRIRVVMEREGGNMRVCMCPRAKGGFEKANILCFPERYIRFVAFFLAWVCLFPLGIFRMDWVGVVGLPTWDWWESHFFPVLRENVIGNDIFSGYRNTLGCVCRKKENGKMVFSGAFVWGCWCVSFQTAILTVSKTRPSPSPNSGDLCTAASTGTSPPSICGSGVVALPVTSS